MPVLLKAFFAPSKTGEMDREMDRERPRDMARVILVARWSGEDGGFGDSGSSSGAVVEADATTDAGAAGGESAFGGSFLLRVARVIRLGCSKGPRRPLGDGFRRVRLILSAVAMRRFDSIWVAGVDYVEGLKSLIRQVIFAMICNYDAEATM